MAQTYIENDWLDLLNGSSWSVPVEGVTKQTYIWAESHSTTLDLNKPIIYDANHVVFVIKPSISQILRQSSTSKEMVFQGDLMLHGRTIANIKSAINALKTLVDSKPLLITYNRGISGNPKVGYFWTKIPYSWKKQLTDT